MQYPSILNFTKSFYAFLSHIEYRKISHSKLYQIHKEVFIFMKYTPTLKRYSDTVPLVSKDLSCSVDVPYAEGAKKFNKFYEKIALRCINYCKHGLRAHLLNSDGEASYSYRLSCKISQSEKGVAVTLTACLCDKLRFRTLARHTETHLWSPALSYLKVTKQKS